MMPQNPIVGGTSLRIAQVQSPNFVHGSTGWAIFKDGSAEFHDIILPNGQGVSVFFAGSAPVTTHVGDLWYDTSNGLLLHHWDGSSWVAQQIGTGAIANNAITTGLIAGGAVNTAEIATGAITTALIAAQAVGASEIANGAITATQIAAAANILGSQIASGTITGSNISAGTITASLLAAGIVVAGIVDGTEVLGATIVADGTTGQFLVYSGTPASGNLIGSWSGAAGTDAFGNTYPAGLSVQQGVITGLEVTGTTITNSTFQGDVLDNSTLSNPNVQGGTIVETAITFDQSGGQLLVYTSTTTTVTQTTAGDYSITFPSDVTNADVECVGSGAGGDGGSTSQGGNAGGAGEYARESNYPVTGGGTYTYTVAPGGTGSSTGGGHGSDGLASFFDSGGVLANGGLGNGTGGTGSTNTTHHNGGNGGGNPSPNTGGSSGGNSGNSTAAGNNGITATSSTGAAAPAAQTGSGRGGAGGNNAANGSSGTGPGGGGGGAGAGTSTTTKTITYSPVWTASFYGPDADVSVANTRRSTTTMFQGGETASGGAFNGNQRCVFGFNRTLIASDFSGYTITHCKITLTNQHSWYNSGMSIEFDYGSGLPSSVPGSWPGGMTQTATGTIAEGSTHTYDLGATVGQSFVTGSSNGLGLGANVPTNNAYNLNYYGYFSNSITMQITGTIGSGSETAGNGADGQVKITYTSGRQLVAALAPAAGSDASLNAYAAGYTGPANVFDPNASPKAVEGWHSATLINGWTKQGYARYKLIGYNLMLIQLQINDTSATSGTFMNMPTGYTATQSQFPELTEFTNSSGVPGNAWIVQVNTGAGGGLNILDWTKKSHQFVGQLLIALD